MGKRKKCTGARYQAPGWKDEYTGFGITGTYEHQPYGKSYKVRLLVHQAGFHLQAWMMTFVVSPQRKNGQEIKAPHVGHPVYTFSMNLKRGKSKIGRRLHFKGEQWQIDLPDEKMTYDTATATFKERKDKSKPALGKPCRCKIVYNSANSIILYLIDGRTRQQFEMLQPPGPDWPYPQLLSQTPTYKWWMLWGDFLSSKDTKAYYQKVLSILQQLHRFDKKTKASLANRLFSYNETTAYKAKLKKLGKGIYDASVAFEHEFGGKGKYPYAEWDFALGYIKYHLYAIKHHRCRNYWYFFLRVLDIQTRFKNRKRFNFVEYFGMPATLSPHIYEWQLQVSDSASVANMADLLRKLSKWGRRVAKWAQFFPDYRLGTITIKKLQPTPWPQAAVYEYVYGFREANLWNSVLEDGVKTKKNTLVVLGQDWTPQDFIGKFDIDPTWVVSSKTQFFVNFKGAGQYEVARSRMAFKQIPASLAKLFAGTGEILTMNSGPSIASTRSRISKSKKHDLQQQSQQVSFKYNAYCLNKKGRQQVREFLARNMKAFYLSWTKIQFDGHASSDGKPRHNLQLSRNRATEVQRFVRHILLSTQMSQKRTKRRRYRRKTVARLNRFMKIKAHGEQISGKDLKEGKTAKWRKVDILLNGRLMVELFGK